MPKKTTHTKEERAIDREIAAGAYASVLTPARNRAYMAAAKNTFAKQRNVNIRISERNLMRLKAAAAKQGVSYQTMVAALIQKHV